MDRPPNYALLVVPVLTLAAVVFVVATFTQGVVLSELALLCVTRGLPHMLLVAALYIGLRHRHSIASVSICIVAVLLALPLLFFVLPERNNEFGQILIALLPIYSWGVVIVAGVAGSMFIRAA